MAKKPGIIKRAVDYVKNGVWQKKDGDFGSKKELWITKVIRLIIYTVQGVNQHGTVVRTAALSFFTIMSLVPIAALAFGILKGLGLTESLNEVLYERFPNQQDIVSSVLNFMEGVIDRTKGGIVAATGLVLLIWSALRVFINTESAFNNIWEVKSSRNIARKAGAYFGIIFIVPVFWILFSGIITYINNVVSRTLFLPNGILFALGSMVIVWIIFSFMYMTIPNTKVWFRNAAVAGLVAAIAFMVFQVIYLYIQRGVNAYNIIYGSFAAIPLLLLWINVSWQIILMGAELSFSLQNLDSYLQERDALTVNYDTRRKITLATMLVIVRKFVNGQVGMSSEEVSHELKIPIRLVRDVIFDLSNAGLLVSSKSELSDKINIYIPAKDVHTLTFYSTLRTVEESGSSLDPSSHSPELEEVSRILNTIKEKVVSSGENIPLVDLLKEEDESNNIG